MKNVKSIIQISAILLALGATAFHAPAVLAHAGEDHGDTASPVQSTQSLAPRAEAHSESVEMLAVYEDRELTLFLSDFNTNAPITGARVEIESGPNKAVAAAAESGAYKVPAPWLAGPGKHGLLVSVEGKEIADLLETTIEIENASAEEQANGATSVAPAALIGSLGGLALIGMLVPVLRRRKK